MHDAPAQFGGGRLARLAPQEPPELALGADQVRARTTLHAMTVDLGGLAHGELTVDVGMKPGPDLHAVHSCSLT